MSVASADFLAAWLPTGRSAAWLVKVQLTDPSSLTLRLATRDVDTLENASPPPHHWQGAISVGSVIEPGDLGAFDPGLATFDFTLLGRPLGDASQSVDDSALTLLSDYYWHGATVTAYLWADGLAEERALQVFKGVVIDVETESNRAIIYCQQPQDWVKRVPDEVTKAKFPRAPEKSIGMPAGAICYGEMLTPEARFPGAPYSIFQQGVTSAVGGRRAGVSGVVVRAGKGAGGEKGRVLFASHACKLFNDDANGSTPMIEAQDRLGDVDPDGANVINGATGTGFDFVEITAADADPFTCWLPVYITDNQLLGSNEADGPRAAADPFADYSYTLLDYDAGNRQAKYRLPDVSPAGLLRGVYAFVGYSFTSGTSLTLDFWNPAKGLSDGVILSGGSSGITDQTVNSVLLSSAGPTQNWNFATDGCYITIAFNGANAGKKARIFYVGLAIQYRPSWPVVTPASSYEIAKPGYYRPKSEWANWYTPKPATRTIEVPETDRVDSRFFATLKGYADDGGGTYTGSAAALIERPPDVVRHFLTTYCSQSSFETGVGEYGSLVDLRSDLVTWRGTDMRIAAGIDDFRQTSDVLRVMARDSMCCFFLSRFSSKWCGFAWKAGRSVTFPRRFRRLDVLEQSGPKVILHRDAVQNDLRVGYGRDAWQRKSMHEVRVSPDASSSGYRFRGIRDENLEIVASESDKLDFSDGTSRTVTLTTGQYEPIALAVHIAGLIAAVTTNGVCQIAWGFEIASSYNQRLDFNDGSARTATLNTGSYTGATLATEVARAMNAVSSNWSCSYSVSTGKFTISRSSGTAQLKFAGVAFGCTTTLGFTIADKTAGSPYTSDFSVYPEQFAIGLKTSTLTLLFETGTNGIDAATPRTCGAVLGFDTARDYDYGTSYASAHSPKNNRELDAANSADRFGRRSLATELEYVNDTDTAREVRNRIFDLWGSPPVEIQFTTDRAPDMGRGMVFDFDADMDDAKPFPVPGTDGSWAGKKFVAVRVEQRPTFEQFVVAYMVPDS